MAAKWAIMGDRDICTRHRQQTRSLCLWSCPSFSCPFGSK